MAVNFGQPPESPEIQSFDPQEFAGDEEQVQQAEDLYSHTDMVKLIRAYTDDDLPTDIKDNKIIKHFWAFFGKAPKLAFLNQMDKYDCEYFLKNAKMNFLLMTPTDEYTFEDEMMLDNIDFHHFINMKRSMGAEGQIINERTMEATAISHNISSNTSKMGSINSKKGGLFSRIGGMF